MNLKSALACFKSYDLRGKLGDEFNEEIVYRVSRATAQLLDAKTVVVGFDARESSPRLADAAIAGIRDTNASVLKIGLAGTEEMYAAVSEFNAGAGIEITASHNPIDYNGMKLIKKGAQPLSNEEFSAIKSLAEAGKFGTAFGCGSAISVEKEARDCYLRKIISFVNPKLLQPIKIVINSGNGAAGPTIDALSDELRKLGVKTNFVYVHHEPDPSFPNGIPNPLLEEKRLATADVVISEGADFGVAFDGDFDRCFLFDHLGNFISGEYVMGLLAEVFLRKEHGAAIVHDTRVVWNTADVVRKLGGRAIVSKTGHVFVKSMMREAKAIYGGEVSAHHYFRDFAYCDSGMIPWLLIWVLLCQKKRPLTELIAERRTLFPSSGEINFEVSNSANCIRRVKDFYSHKAVLLDEVDGLSITFKNWRFNLRESNTESLLRLNVETKNDDLLLVYKIKELENIIIGPSTN